jgi:hypothetical protein
MPKNSYIIALDGAKTSIRRTKHSLALAISSHAHISLINALTADLEAYQQHCESIESLIAMGPPKKGS